MNGAPRRIRTPNLLIRSQVLYPIELSVHSTALGGAVGIGILGQGGVGRKGGAACGVGDKDARHGGTGATEEKTPGTGPGATGRALLD